MEEGDKCPEGSHPDENIRRGKKNVQERGSGIVEKRKKTFKMALEMAAA